MLRRELMRCKCVESLNAKFKMHFSSSPNFRIKISLVINLLGNDKMDAFMEDRRELMSCKYIKSFIPEKRKMYVCSAAQAKAKPNQDSEVVTIDGNSEYTLSRLSFRAKKDQTCEPSRTATIL
jgi:hypothetical protein